VIERSAEYPGIKVLPISFKSSELKAAHWKFLMGAVGSQSMYIRQVGLIMKKLRDELTLGGLRKGIEDAGLSDHLKELALLRLRFAEEYINDEQHLTSVLRPDRLIRQRSSPRSPRERPTFGAARRPTRRLRATRSKCGAARA